ncbi:MAG: hypothetical protein R3F62_30365 [Planctomycetota bacterium]
MAEQDLSTAIRELIAQKDEHRDLVRQIAADPGMNPRLRETLLSHIYEEETEKVQALQALAGGGSAPAAVSSPLDGGGRGLTVGSLRPASPTSPGGSVGSLLGH